MFKLVIWIPIVVIATILSRPASAREPLPSLPTETLSGKQLVLPKDLTREPHLFIIGFTRASSPQTEVWSRRTLDEYGKSGEIEIYQVVVLADVPRFIQRFVIGQIRGGVPKPLHDRFLLVTQKLHDWKRLAAFAQPDLAYLVLVDDQHEIVWRSVGALSDASLRSLNQQLKALGLDHGTR